jgi:superfamily II DNA or RNA helicase/HKD family nuclease
VTDSDFIWPNQFRKDIEFGYINDGASGLGLYSPKLVLNQDGRTVEHSIVEELVRCRSFTFSVAFISAGAIAQLKQHFRDFAGFGRIVTSDYLAFNQPRAFEELLNLKEQFGIEVRRHEARSFHPKGYVFEQQNCITAIIGSSNLTSSALSQNHEWNIKVSAAMGSDLAHQMNDLINEQVSSSIPLTHDWVDHYSSIYKPPAPRLPHSDIQLDPLTPAPLIQPNQMQGDALLALDFVRAEGAERAVIISATGTGKTMLSALEVRAVNPSRLLFIAHREQILDRTIVEFQKVLGGNRSDYGKLSGASKQIESKYVFATIQSLSQPDLLEYITPTLFDYIIIDEAHRSGAESYNRVIDHFKPKFLLGMTATPERTDGFNVFELFHYNVPYEIRLHQALAEGMLSPFHYYGVSDLTYTDGSTTSDASELSRLTSIERVNHIISAIEIYGQSGVDPRGLIFCSRIQEAESLSLALNELKLRGTKLRTVALSGENSVEERERHVSQLESGNLDYILTVDIFSEGVDIPSVNQVIMLRQTQSAIVFVQQLGRGLRLSSGKEYLVVIDFIGNYNNNFLIPIALFGDESLNRESLRERLNETVEGGALPGLSSVSFDEISRERILNSITRNNLDSMANLKVAFLSLQNRLGGTPKLWDFYRFKSVDPILLATKQDHFPALIQSLLQVDPELSEESSRALNLFSHEVMAAKRLHEFCLLELLLKTGSVRISDLKELFEVEGLLAGEVQINGVMDTLLLRGYPRADINRYRTGVIELVNETIRLTQAFRFALEENPRLRVAIKDLIKTGKAVTRDRYGPNSLFTPGMQYSRRDAARIVGWPRATASTIYGYKSDVESGICTVFVTLEKSSGIGASTAYQDELLDPSTLRWYSKSRRSLASKDVAGIISGQVKIFVFVKKDDALGSDHYYLGRATTHDAEETTMAGTNGEPLSVVTMLLKFDEPIQQGLFDYFYSREKN